MFLPIPSHPEGSHSFPSPYPGPTAQFGAVGFKVCFVNLDALFERAAFLPRPLHGVPQSTYPALRFCTLKGFQMMLFRTCVDADCLCVLYFVVLVVVVVDFFFFLEALPPPLIPFFDNSPDTPSFPPFSSFLFYFHTVLFFRPSRLRSVA